MAKITIRRHGDRWALHEDPDATPVAEYETRELAEAAAGDDYVVDETPHGEDLGHGGTGPETGVRSRDAGIDQRTGGGGSGHDTPREDQAGL